LEVNSLPEGRAYTPLNPVTGNVSLATSRAAAITEIILLFRGSQYAR